MTKGMLSIVAAGLLVGGTIASAQEEKRSQTPNTPRDQQSVPEATRTGRTGAVDNSNAAADKQGKAAKSNADQQLNQQLRKISQEGGEMAGDKLFLLEAATGSLFEIELSQVAQQKSQNQQVKQVAEMIIRDHQQASQQLSSIAPKLGVQPPSQLSMTKQQKVAIYQNMDSTAFDKAYIACMDAAHAHDVTSFRHHAQHAKNEDVKQFASATLPKLQEHHQMVKQAGASLGMSDDSAQPAGAKMRNKKKSQAPSDQGSSNSGSSAKPADTNIERENKSGQPR